MWESGWPEDRARWNACPECMKELYGQDGCDIQESDCGYRSRSLLKPHIHTFSVWFPSTLKFFTFEIIFLTEVYLPAWNALVCEVNSGRNGFSSTDWGPAGKCQLLPLHRLFPSSLSSQFVVTSAPWMHSIWIPQKMLRVQGWKALVML